MSTTSVTSLFDGIRRRFDRPLLTATCVALALSLMAADAPRAYAAGAEAPFGDKVSAAVTNYNRTRPTIGTAGVLKEGAVAELKALGFATILDLRGPDEGTAAEKAAVEAAGLRYLNIPVTAQAPTDAQVADFTRIVEDSGNKPLLIHCHTANRVGAMWTLYRARKGVPFAIAVEEGRTIGLQPSRENAVRARLGQPPLSNSK